MQNKRHQIMDQILECGEYDLDLMDCTRRELEALRRLWGKGFIRRDTESEPKGNTGTVTFKQQ